LVVALAVSHLRYPKMIDEIRLRVLRGGSVINSHMLKKYRGTLTINVDGLDRYFFSDSDTVDEAINELLSAYKHFTFTEEEPVPTP